MLERIREHSRSLLIYLLFGIIIAVFIISFGPQSVGGFAGPQGIPASTAGSVAGADLSATDYRNAYTMSRAAELPTEFAKAQRAKERLMDMMIERELLAQEARRLGIVVSEREAENHIAESKMILFGRPQLMQGWQKENGAFDYDLFERFVQSMGTTPKLFVEQQRRELTAARVRDLLSQSVNVSADEVKDRYIRQGNQVNLEYLRFAIGTYEVDLEPTVEELAAYVNANTDKLKQEFDQRKFNYENVPRERQVTYAAVRVAPAPPPAPADSAASSDTSSAEAVKAARDKNVKTAEERLNRLATELKGGAEFAAVSRKEAAKPSAPDAPAFEWRRLGWRRQGATGLGEAVEKQIFDAAEGAVVGPVTTDDGVYLVKVAGSREGNLTFDQVKNELAESAWRTDEGKRRAREAAESALATARAAAPDKAWKDVFAPAEVKEGAKPATGPAPPQPAETGFVSRQGNVVEGIGVSAELAKKAFELTKEAPFAGPFEVGGAFVVVRLKEKNEADLAEFEKSRGELMRAAADAKGQAVVAEWVLRRCREAKAGNDIQVNRDILTYEDGKPNAVPYEPCTPPSPFMGL
jgi:peptidyl-prolyl cis-trans isomerase D